MRPLCCLHRWGRKPQKKKKKKKSLYGNECEQQILPAPFHTSTESPHPPVDEGPRVQCGALPPQTSLIGGKENAGVKSSFIRWGRKGNYHLKCSPPSMCRCRTVRCEHRWLNLPLEVPSISQIYTLMSSIPQLFSRPSNQLLKLCSIAGAYSTKIS